MCRSRCCVRGDRTPIITGGVYGRNDGVSDADLLKSAETMRPMAPERFAERALRAVLGGDAIIVVTELGISAVIGVGARTCWWAQARVSTLTHRVDEIASLNR